jgi:Phosphotransferase enzyme family
VAPRCASTRAVSKPIPVFAPVTTATRPTSGGTEASVQSPDEATGEAELDIRHPQAPSGFLPAHVRVTHISIAADMQRCAILRQALYRPLPYRIINCVRDNPGVSDDEESLPGNVTIGAVRIGNTVRRPVGPWTDAVDALLMHLHAVGFRGAPRCLGRDDLGRQVLEYVHGQIGDPAGTYSVTELASIGQLLRDYHVAVAEFQPPAAMVWNRLIPPDAEELICHNDAAPWNLVKADRGWVLIDWDAAAPGSRLWDLAYSAQSMAGLSSAEPPQTAAERLRAFVDGYGLIDEQRPALAAMLGRRARAMYDLLRTGAARHQQPWERIWTEDGPYWRNTADYLDAHIAAWTTALG